jgi:hypothetical protein
MDRGESSPPYCLYDHCGWKDLHSQKVHNASAEHKTVEQLMVQLEDVIATVQDEWGAIIVAIVTDALGECRKARRLLG